MFIVLPESLCLTLFSTVTLPGSMNKKLKEDIETALASVSAIGTSGVSVADDAKINMGGSNDVTIEWDTASTPDQLQIGALTDDTIITFGISAATQKSFDITWFANEANGASSLNFDAGDNFVYTTGVDFQIKDNDYVVFGDGSDKTGDVQITWDTANLIISATADDTLIEIGDSALAQLSFDLKWYGHQASGASYLFFDASADLVYTTGIDLQFKDNDILVIGSGAGAAGDVQFVWDATNFITKAIVDDTLWEIGDSANPQLSFDIKWYAQQASGASYLYFDADKDSIYTTGVDFQIKDADYIVFGTGTDKTGDVQITWDATNLLITATADDTLIEIGDSALVQLSFDVKWYANEASGASYLYFSAANNVVYTTGVDIQFKDNDILVIGSGAGVAGDVQFVWDTTNLIMKAVVDDTVWEIGDADAAQKSFDVKWYANENNGASYLYFDAGGNFVYTTGVDIQIKDDDFITFGSGSDSTGDIQIEWDTTGTDALRISATADDTLIEFGIAATPQLSVDLKWYANEAAGASYLYFDADVNLVYTTGVDIQFKDNDILVIGSGAGAAGDVQYVWDTTNLIMKAIADDTLWEIGDSANPQLSFDIKWYGNAASGAEYLYFDASESLLFTTGIDLQFLDTDFLVFGTGTDKTGDVQIQWDGTNLLITATADDSIIEFGDANATQKSFDIKAYGNAANGADYLFWDASNSKLTTVGAAVIAGRVDDANGIGLTLSVKSTTGDPGTTGTALGSVVWNEFDQTLNVKATAGWVGVALS